MFLVYQETQKVKAQIQNFSEKHPSVVFTPISVDFSDAMSKYANECHKFYSISLTVKIST